MRDRPGFTLIELMIVLAIAAVVSAITIPSMIGWLPNYRIRSVVDDLNSAFQVARMRAIRENANVVIRINGSNTEVEVFVDNGGPPPGGGSPDNQVREVQEARVKLVEIPDDVELYETSFTGNWAAYNNRGFPRNNKLGQIRLKNAQDRYLGIAMNITGNARIIESHDYGATWN
jgi:type IV fimbrial biogenesis protein FimT